MCSLYKLSEFIANQSINQSINPCLHFFGLMNVCLSLSDEVNTLSLISEYWKSNTISGSSIGEFDPDILFEKSHLLQRMYEFIKIFLPTRNLAVFDCSYFLCYWLQRAETCTNCSNWPALSTFDPNLYTTRFSMSLIPRMLIFFLVF